MDTLMLTVTGLLTAAFTAFVIHRYRRQHSLWSQVADTLELRRSTRTFWQFPRMAGTYRDHHVEARCHARPRLLKLNLDPRDHVYSYEFVADLKTDCFEGFSMVEKHLSDSLVTSLGGEDLEIGHEMLDSEFRLRGEPGERARRVLDIPRVREMLYLLTREFDRVILDEGRLQLEIRGEIDSSDELSRRIQQLAAVAEMLDDAAGADPDDIGELDGTDDLFPPLEELDVDSDPGDGSTEKHCEAPPTRKEESGEPQPSR